MSWVDDCSCDEANQYNEECFECGSRDGAGFINGECYCGDCYGPANAARKDANARRAAAKAASLATKTAAFCAQAGSLGPEES